MKKIFSTLVTLMLVFSLLFTFTGCDDQSKLVGTWKAEVQFGEAMNELFNSSSDTKEMAEYFDFDDLVLVITLEFDDDDTYKMYVDEDDNKDFAPTIKKVMVKGLEEYLSKELEGSGITVDQVLQSQNTTLEDLVDQIISDDKIEEVFAEMEQEGDYLAEDGKLYLDDEDEYKKYELEGKKLTLKSSSKDDDDEMTKLIYPMVFEKQ